MKQLTINTGSWHYKFASFADYDRHSKSKQNLCMYLRYVMLGMVTMTFVITLVSGVAIAGIAPFGDLIAWLIASAWVGFPINSLSELGEAAVLLGILYIIVGIIALITNQIISWKDQRRYRQYELERLIASGDYVAPPMTFGQAVYRKFHDKTCMKVDFS